MRSSVVTSTTLPAATRRYTGRPVDCSSTQVSRHSSLTSPLWLDTAVRGILDELGSPVESTATLAEPSAMPATHAR